MNDKRCTCSMSISMLGDGCRYCQPQEHIDRLGEWLDEEREQVSELEASARDGGDLVRYGIEWAGPKDPIAVPMDDGYWTPWHLANQKLTRASAVVSVANEHMLNEGVRSMITGLKKFPKNYEQVVSNIWEDMASLLQQDQES